MNTQLVYWFCAAIIVALSFSFFVFNRKAFGQTPDDVVTREPGKRLLGAPKPVATEANKDLEFAWMSQSAYEKIGQGNTPDADSSSDKALKDAGWTLWPNFPDDGLLQQISKSHLRVQVWANPASKSVAVAFGGTVFKNCADWRSNLRWFLPTKNDEYSAVVRELAPRFIEKFLEQAQEMEWAFLKQATFYSTGHSLGGGLAQQFAYALPLNDRVPRVKQVFALDPSPVTGFYSVNKNTRDQNKNGLKIDRIYERREILAIARSLMSFIYPPTSINPTIRQVRYDLFPTVNPITGHSISELASKLADVAQLPIGSEKRKSASA